ncbi:hypothetical protein BBK36DRAFT_1191440 [Trichoderma citrinoviride]|uniref:Uncharacterized protein n=1 Tax=Trichoderma citrinoviride TaxID=58853 RepID=A0A2T4BH52_9HYPO|nr:hypothetical protein BBK36DRAFT_1191440 [Trichoderma citrinoviride]PTB68654.1 hypothetical protein BBK36DRAFT_1191440 [Trichoderma citrinoviride]
MAAAHGSKGACGRPMLIVLFNGLGDIRAGTGGVKFNKSWTRRPIVCGASLYVALTWAWLWDSWNVNPSSHMLEGKTATNKEEEEGKRWKSRYRIITSPCHHLLCHPLRDPSAVNSVASSRLVHGQTTKAASECHLAMLCCKWSRHQPFLERRGRASDPCTGRYVELAIPMLAESQQTGAVGGSGQLSALYGGWVQMPERLWVQIIDMPND